MMRLFCSQVGGLLIKNILRKSRQPITTLAEICLPISVIFLLVYLRSIIEVSILLFLAPILE
jgi:hypothetical protein